MMIAKFVIGGIGRTKFDNSLGIIFAAFFSGDDFETVPVCGAAPGNRSLLVEFRLNGGRSAGFQEFNMLRDVSAVTRSHELFGSIGLA